MEVLGPRLSFVPYSQARLLQISMWNAGVGLTSLLIPRPSLSTVSQRSTQRDPWQECDLKGSHMQPGCGPEQGTWPGWAGEESLEIDVWLADGEAARRVCESVRAPCPTRPVMDGICLLLY